MSTDRGWMYMRMDTKGFLRREYVILMDGFLDVAFANESTVGRKRTPNGIVLRIRCPCLKCRNIPYKERDAVRVDLMKHGFMDNYTKWWAHGETHQYVSDYQHIGQSSTPTVVDDHMEVVDDPNQGYAEMVNAHMEHDAMTWEEQTPNPNAKKFYDMLKDVDEPLWNVEAPTTSEHSKLGVATRLLNIKAECNMPDATFNRIASFVNDILPKGNKMPSNIYETKKSLSGLSQKKERIHACKNHCMLFYKDDSTLTHCRVCNESRYKTSGRGKVPHLVLTYMPIIPRLQELYMSEKTSKEMTWHYDHQTEPGMMVHPSDGEAWKHFDRKDHDFASEIRNVRLGLCTDGFNPNNSNTNPYSTWPVFVTVYNLPPWMALKPQYVRLALVIPGRKSPGQNLDVFLRPLIDDLKMLYTVGVLTYDAYRKNNFEMRAILLWTVSDFPAYAMLSGWSTHGKLACPYCMGTVDSFQLKNGGKPCWFDCHRRWLPTTHPFRRDQQKFTKGKRVPGSVGPPPDLTGEQIYEQVRHYPTVYEGSPFRSKNKKISGFGTTHNWVKKSIFWELPYWKMLLIRHNLDVMHIEKNVFENLFNTVMDTSKTKDNVKARRDVELYCDRQNLHIRKEGNKVVKPKSSYSLSKQQLKQVCEWLKKLKFPDGYASNIGGCVNLEDYSFYSFKSHDCHVFMQRLLPIALRGMIPTPIWDAITELCTFFRVICSRVLHTEDLITLQKNIVQTICNLEKVFPPGWFDSMEHLVIHLTREAINGGPVQYRWMYLYER